MREGWKILPFGEVCEISGGSQPPKSNFIYEAREGYIRLVQVRDYRTDKFITYIPKDKAKKFCSTTDIMIGRYGPPIFGIFDGIEGAYNVALMKAIPNEQKLNKEYFRWFLKSDDLTKFVEKTSKRAAGQDGVRKERLYTYPVPIPPIEEQKQIAVILNKAFTAIDQAKANIEKNIENAKELFQSKLNDIFSQKGDGWEEMILDNICTKITQGPNPKLRNDIPSENNYVLKTKDFYNDRVLYDKCIKVSESIIKEWSRFILKNDDLIIGLVGVGSIGKSNLFQEQEGGKYIFTRATGLIRTIKEILLPNYLRFYLLSGLGIELINKGIGGTTGQLVIKTSYLKKLKIIIPTDLNTQEYIINQAEIIQSQTEEIIRIYNEKLNNLEDLKKSILQKAFAGELTEKVVVI